MAIYIKNPEIIFNFEAKKELENQILTFSICQSNKNSTIYKFANHPLFDSKLIDLIFSFLEVTKFINYHNTNISLAYHLLLEDEYGFYARKSFKFVLETVKRMQNIPDEDYFDPYNDDCKNLYKLKKEAEEFQEDERYEAFDILERICKDVHYYNWFRGDGLLMIFSKVKTTEELKKMFKYPGIMFGKK